MGTSAKKYGTKKQYAVTECKARGLVMKYFCTVLIHSFSDELA